MIENFDQKDFSKRVNEELAYLGMEKIFLAKCVYVSEDRMKFCLSGKIKFKPDEITRIEKVLGMK